MILELSFNYWVQIIHLLEVFSQSGSQTKNPKIHLLSLVNEMNHIIDFLHEGVRKKTFI